MLHCFVFNTSLFIIIFLAPVAQKMNSTIHLISLQAKKHLISLMRIHWIVIYPADSMILCLNKRGLMKLRDLSQGPWLFFFFCLISQPTVQQPAGYWAVPVGGMPGGVVPAGAMPGGAVPAGVIPGTVLVSNAGVTAPSQGGAQVTHSFFYPFKAQERSTSIFS